MFPLLKRPISVIMFRKLNFSNFCHHRTCPRGIMANHLSTIPKISDSLSKFGSEERSKVLETLNTATEDQLGQYKLSKKCLCALLDHRNNHGLLYDLESLLNIDGFTLPNVKKLCKSILCENNVETKKSKLVTNPVLTKEKIQGIRDMVSIDPRVARLSFTHLTRENEVLRWETVKVPNELLKYDDISLLHSMAETFVKLIPPADVYILEQEPFKPQKNKSVAGLVMKKILDAVVFALLKSKEREVVYVKKSAVSRHFLLLVGNERVSGQQLVEHLVRPCDDGNARLRVSEELQEYYRRLEAVERECMCNALLLAVAFNEAIIHS